MEKDKKALRGKLLSFLRYVHPDEAEEGAIIGTYYEYHEPEAIRRELEYLVDKGYLNRNEKPHPFKERKKVRLYKISPDGIDLQDGVKDDPAVTILE